MRKTNKGFALALVSLMTLAMLPSPAFAQSAPAGNAQGQYGEPCDPTEENCAVIASDGDGGVATSQGIPGGIFDISGALAAPITQGSAELEESLAAETDTSGVALAATSEQTPAPADDSTGEAPIYVTESASGGSSGGSADDSGEITVLPNTGGAPLSPLLLGVMLVIGGFVTRRYLRASRGGF